jgi:hypothetical protein
VISAAAPGREAACFGVSGLIIEADIEPFLLLRTLFTLDEHGLGAEKSSSILKEALFCSERAREHDAQVKVTPGRMPSRWRVLKSTRSTLHLRQASRYS